MNGEPLGPGEVQTPTSGQTQQQPQQPSQPQQPKSLRELLEERIRRLLERIPLLEGQVQAIGDWMYKWDDVNQRWVAKAVGSMSEEEKQALRAQGYMTYDEASVFSRRTHGVVSPVAPDVYRTQLTPIIVQQLAAEQGALLPLLQLLAQIESAEARAGGGGGGFLGFLGTILSGPIGGIIGRWLEQIFSRK